MTVGGGTRKGRRKLHLPKPAQMPLTPSAAGHEEEHQPTYCRKIGGISLSGGIPAQRRWANL
jgi:hypothetical protein